MTSGIRWKIFATFILCFIAGECHGSVNITINKCTCAWPAQKIYRGILIAWICRIYLFSSPEPKARESYCHSAPSVVRPSVVVRRRPSGVNFSHFWLLLWNRWREFNETWQEARSQRALPSLCFSGRSERQDGRPGLWLAETFSTSPL